MEQNRCFTNNPKLIQLQLHQRARLAVALSRQIDTTGKDVDRKLPTVRGAGFLTMAMLAAKVSSHKGMAPHLLHRHLPIPHLTLTHSFSHQSETPRVGSPQ